MSGAECRHCKTDTTIGNNVYIVGLLFERVGSNFHSKERRVSCVKKISGCSHRGFATRNVIMLPFALPPWSRTCRWTFDTRFIIRPSTLCQIAVSQGANSSLQDSSSSWTPGSRSRICLGIMLNVAPVSTVASTSVLVFFPPLLEVSVTPTIPGMGQKWHKEKWQNSADYHILSYTPPHHQGYQKDHCDQNAHSASNSLVATRWCCWWFCLFNLESWLVLIAWHFLTYQGIGIIPLWNHCNVTRVDHCTCQLAQSVDKPQESNDSQYYHHLKKLWKWLL